MIKFVLLVENLLFTCLFIKLTSTYINIFYSINTNDEKSFSISQVILVTFNCLLGILTTITHDLVHLTMFTSSSFVVFILTLIKYSESIFHHLFNILLDIIILIFSLIYFQLVDVEI